MTDGWFKARKKPKVVSARGPYYESSVIDTLEGQFEVDEEYTAKGFYIISGVEDEQHPIRKDIFENIYEVVSNDTGNSNQ